MGKAKWGYSISLLSFWSLYFCLQRFLFWLMWLGDQMAERTLQAMRWASDSFVLWSIFSTYLESFRILSPVPLAVLSSLVSLSSLASLLLRSGSGDPVIDPNWILTGINIILAAIVAWRTMRLNETKQHMDEAKQSVEYWRGIVDDLRARIIVLEAQTARTRAAFEFLCDFFGEKFPEIVKVARELESGIMTRKDETPKKQG